MARLSLRLTLFAPAALAAALVTAAPAASREEVVPDRDGALWRGVATKNDLDRVRHWRDAWTEALAEANRSNAAAITAGGALFDPDTALPGAQPPAGDYACRTIKLGRMPPGGSASGTLDYVEYPAFRCRISETGGRLRFTKLTGSQRPAGNIFPDNGRRLMMVSDYDGSWESYIDEFAEMILSGLDAIWETARGYPPDGAADLPAFKRFLRTHQVPAEVFFSAYPRETILNIANNARTRDAG